MLIPGVLNRELSSGKQASLIWAIKGHADIEMFLSGLDGANGIEGWRWLFIVSSNGRWINRRQFALRCVNQYS